MSIYKQSFVQYMDANGIKYTECDDRTVKIVYGGDYLRSISVYVFFDKEDKPLVEFKCGNFASFNGFEDVGMDVCNSLNAQYRWVKFYIDKNSDVIADADCILDAASGGEECMTMVRRIVNIVDESFFKFMQAIFEYKNKNN